MVDLGLDSDRLLKKIFNKNGGLEIKLDGVYQVIDRVE